jgi:DnaJ family protein A protein 5
MPHCSRALYESLFTINFGPSLASRPKRVLLGNELAEYLPDLVTLRGDTEQPSSAEFVKPKKKRKGRQGGDREFQDSVLRRLGKSAPHIARAVTDDADQCHTLQRYLSQICQRLICLALREHSFPSLSSGSRMRKCRQ